MAGPRLESGPRSRREPCSTPTPPGVVDDPIVADQRAAIPAHRDGLPAHRNGLRGQPNDLPGDADDPVGRMLALAYRHLNRRDCTVAEMRLHLERRCADADAVDTAIELLREQGYLDDARFARLFTQDKRELEQWGNDRIERALVGRGIDRDLVRQTLGQSAPEAEFDRALELLRRRFPSPPTDRRGRDRALGVLLRKGYDNEVALDALGAHARGG
jgi:regulatory protein